MGCVEQTPKPHIEDDPTPLINLLIVGLSNSGKSTILNQLKGQPQSSSTSELGIDSFVINNKLKIITFQVAGRAQSSWHNYYSTCQIVLFVIDVMENSEFTRIQRILADMDGQLENGAKIILIFNKIDQILRTDVKGSEMEEVSHITEYLDKKSNSLLEVEKLQFGELSHQVFTCKCSGRDKIGLNGLLKKIYSLGVYLVGSENKEG